MIEPINNGGPAFPSEQSQTLDHMWNQTIERGMSLRDWFAGMALQNLLFGTNPNRERISLSMEKCVAETAYQIADAMIAARTKTP